MRPEVRRWGLPVALAVVLALTGIRGLATLRYGEVAAQPWVNVFLAMAAVGAVIGLLLGILRAHTVQEDPSPDAALRVGSNAICHTF